jgi:hypothetical protein
VVVPTPSIWVSASTIIVMLPATPTAGDRFFPEVSYPVEIGQQIEGLHHHAHGQERRHMQQMPGDRTLGKIFHRCESSCVAVRLSRMSVANCRGRRVARNFFLD